MKAKHLLTQYKYDCHLLERVPCTKEETKEYYEMLKSGQSIPEGIYRDTDSTALFRVKEVDLTEKETREYLMLEQLKQLRNIKKCMIFFVVLTVISLIFTIISVVGSLSLVNAFR